MISLVIFSEFGSGTNFSNDLSFENERFLIRYRRHDVINCDKYISRVDASTVVDFLREKFNFCSSRRKFVQSATIFSVVTQL